MLLWLYLEMGPFRDGHLNSFRKFGRPEQCTSASLALLPGAFTALQCSFWSWNNDVITTPANFLMYRVEYPY
jgi:hypothetical protein